MATAYEARVVVVPRDATASVRDALEQLDRTGSPSHVEVRSAPGDLTRLVVRILLDADDASIAQLAARERVVRALRDAGVGEGAVDIGDVEVRSSS